MWGTHHVDGWPVLLRYQRPRGAWAGYPSGWCPRDVRIALRDLANGMTAMGYPDLRCNCIGRDPEQDAEFRGQGGRAAHSPASWSAGTVGWHLSGRAVDVTLPQDETRAAYVADMLTIGSPHGWTPIPGEDWHIERRGPWTNLASVRGSREGGLGALLDVGGWRGPRWEWRAVQAQLWRIGIDAGPLDGQPGALTRQALKTLGISGEPGGLLPTLYTEPSVDQLS